MKAGYVKQSFSIKKSVQVLLILTLLFSIPHSTQTTFAKSSAQQTQPVNLAYQKPTDQSSIFSDNFCTGSSGNAVDGITNGNWTNQPCTVTHTEKDDQPWWWVDLGTKT